MSIAWRKAGRLACGHIPVTDTLETTVIVLNIDIIDSIISLGSPSFPN